MIPVEIDFENYKIRCIEKDDIENILNCINELNKTSCETGVSDLFTYKDIEDRYIETLLNSLDYFCVIKYGDNFIGLIKGYIENKRNINSIWISSLVIFKQYDSEELRSKIINKIENYFMNNFSVNKFYMLKEAKVNEANNYKKYFGYSLRRVVDNNKNNSIIMLILEKNRDKTI